MNLRDMLGGGAFGAAGLVVVRYALELPLGTLTRPGPGFVPLGLGIGLTALSLVTLVHGVRSTATGGRPRGRVAVARVLAVPGAMLLFAIALHWLGYLLSAVLLMWALFALASPAPASWRPLVAALATTGLSYLLFHSLLEAGLPAGRLWGQ